MDRQIVYPGAIPLETDILNSNKYAMLGLSRLSQALLGANTLFFGLSCSQQVAPNMSVRVAPGDMYSMATVDFAAFGSLPLDTSHSVLKQGISLDTLNFNCPAPGVAGQSINYLIQATYADVDANPVTLPYYNSSNPLEAYSGPANSGAAQFTTRKGVCNITLKTGVAAATGSQATPAPDIGYTALYTVTVAYGATSIIDANIQQVLTAPALPGGGIVLGGIQQNRLVTGYATGTVNAITANFTPDITTIVSGMILYVRPLGANTTTTPTFKPNINALTALPIVKGNNKALVPGDIAGAAHWIALLYDITINKWVLMNPAKGVAALGANQTSVSMLGSRAAATTYTNTTDAPIFISIIWRTTATIQTQGVIFIDDEAACSDFITGPSEYGSNTAIVPSGSTYRFSGQSNVAIAGVTLHQWNELR